VTSGSTGATENATFTGLPASTSYNWYVVFSNTNANSTSSSWRFTIGTCQVVPPSSPVLVSPSDGFVYFGPQLSLGWSLFQLGIPCITGSNVFNVSYSQTYPTNLYGPRSSIQLSAANTTLLLTNLGGGTWYWWVTFSNGVNETSSAVQSFVWCSTQTTLALPTLISPPNNTVILSPAQLM